MNNQPKDGGPAFPHAVQKLHSSYASAIEGMSLRDWFAGQALAGLCADSEFRGKNTISYVSFSYDLADAMLAARNRKP